MSNLPALQAARLVFCALLLNPSIVSGQQNLGFEVNNGDTPDGWQVRGGSIDTAVRSEGTASLRLASTGSQLPPGAVTGIASQTVASDAFVGDRIRLAADIKTEAIDSGYAGIWLRVDGDRKSVVRERVSECV